MKTFGALLTIWRDPHWAANWRKTWRQRVWWVQRMPDQATKNGTLYQLRIADTTFKLEVHNVTPVG